MFTFPKGRKQFISFPVSSFPGRHSPFLKGRKQFISFQAVHSQPGAHFAEGRKQLSSNSGHSGRQARQAASQAGAHHPSGEGSNSAITRAVPPFLVTVLPPKQAVRPLHIPLLGKALPKQATTSLQVREAVKLLGQAGKTTGIQPGKGPPGIPRGTALPPRQTALVPGKATLHLIPKWLPQGFSQKTPTQSGSLTNPANLWHQLKCLFFVYPLSNLLT